MAAVGLESRLMSRFSTEIIEYDGNSFSVTYKDKGAWRKTLLIGKRTLGTILWTVAPKLMYKIRARLKYGAAKETPLIPGEVNIPDYEAWRTGKSDGGTPEALNESREADVPGYTPRISVLVPVYNVLDKHLVPCIESVIAQTYDNWELCLVDDCSTMESVRNVLHRYDKDYKDDGSGKAAPGDILDKIKVHYRTENGHISAATNDALDMATGEYIAFLDCDDLLSRNALYEVVKKLNEDPETDFIYSDEDKIDSEGVRRHEPFYKPDWSPDTLMSLMYTCHLGVYRTSLARDLGGLRVGYEGAQDYDFALRFTERTDRIAHISEILYHWREREESTALSAKAKTYVGGNAYKAKQDALTRRGLKGDIVPVKKEAQLRVRYISGKKPLVSIIIPSKDNYKVLSRCIRSIKDRTEYENYEIVVVDNGSTSDIKEKVIRLLAVDADTSGNANAERTSPDGAGSEIYEGERARYIYSPSEFNFSKMCNMGAAAAKGDMLLFLNDDTRVINGDWLGLLTGHAELSHVGAVGAKLLYPRGKKIQHTGVINILSGPVHAFGGFSDKLSYYFGRNRLDYNWLAVTGACLMVSREKYDEVGGWNEDMAVAYNDVDLCFRLYEAGYYNVVRTDAVLIHYESVSRGIDFDNPDKFRRLMRDQDLLYKLHPDLGRTDPFYNRNLRSRAADFSAKTEPDPDFKSDVIEIGPGDDPGSLVQPDSDIDGLIESVIVESQIRITGWAVPRGFKGGDIGTVLLLESDYHKYKVSAEALYKPYTALSGADDTFSIGFRADFNWKSVAPGTYRISIICGDKIKDTGNCFTI